MPTEFSLMHTRLAVLLSFLLIIFATAVILYKDRLFTPTVAPKVSNVPVDKSASLPFDEVIKAEIRHYFESIELSPKENDLNHAIQLDHSVGRVQLSEGKNKEAYRTYQKVLAISYRQGSLMGIGIALNMLADLLQRNNNPTEAIHASLLAYKTTQAMNNKEEIGVMELSFARMLRKQDLSLSMMWLLRAKESLKGTRYKEDYVRLLADLAHDLRMTGELERASRFYEDAWESGQSLGNAPGQKWAKWETGLDYAMDLIRHEKNKEAARILHETESLFSVSEKNSESYTKVLYQLARVYAALKNDGKARHYYLLAYTNYELTRAEALGEDGRATLDNGHKGLVDNFVSHYLQSKDYAMALALLESNKARTLNDILEDPEQKQVYVQWKELEQRQARDRRAFLDKKEDELLPLQEDNFSGLVELYKNQLVERRKLQVALQLKEITVTRGISKEHLETIQRQLSSDMAVLSFFVAAERASVFLITRDGLRHIPLPFDAWEYRRAIQPLRVALTNPYNDFYREPAQWLFDKLLSPVVKALPKTVKILLYSPDGILSRIPIGALMDGKRFVAERYAVYRIPSLRYLKSISKVKSAPVQTGIACVDPDVSNARLPFQHETGQTLQKLYGKKLTLLTGKECSEEKLVTAINGGHAPTFLHIGAHGNFYPHNPMDSAILLSGGDGNKAEGRLWNARAMATVNMSRLDLVTLSSCETGLTDPKVKRDVFGIARALYFAGTKKFVVPLWAVHDQAAAELMRAFYHAYSKNIPAVLALQHAQMQLIESKRYRHPYYWSAFVLMGQVR